MSLNNIIIHHTGGTWKCSNTDAKCYHFIIEGNGNVVHGFFKPEDNINCKDGKYAPHTYLGNTGAIGIALAANYNQKEKNPTQTAYPITENQLKSLKKLCNELMVKHKIPLNKIETHYEHDKRKNIKQGKIDIIYLPQYPDCKKDCVGTKLRYIIGQTKEKEN